MKILVYLMPVILLCHCDKDFLERISTKEPPKWGLVNMSKCPAKEKKRGQKKETGGEGRTKRNVSGAVAEKFRLILLVKTCKTHEWSKPKKF